MKILVADDDAVSRLLLQRMLRGSDYEVVTATNGLEAVECLSMQDGPRLVLLDWTMPGLSGLEVCQAVRSGVREAYVYIALLTSKDSKEDLVLGLEAGADDYLTKPCHPEELRARLRTGCRILQLEDILVGAREEMRVHATHDSLTKLLNRKGIFDVFSSNLIRLRSQMADFSLMLCDVDHFKKINDTYGHLVGDEVLQEIGIRLNSSVRRGFAGRYGGEEFLLLLAGCAAHQLTAAAHRVCEIIAAEPIQTSAGPLRVTLSAGAVTIDLMNRQDTAEMFLQKADRLLYQAKREGRNRAVIDRAHPVVVELCQSEPSEATSSEERRPEAVLIA